MAEGDTIRVLVSDIQPSKSALPSLWRQAVLRTVDVDLDEVSANIRTLVEKFGRP